MSSNNAMMESVVDLMWTVEGDEPPITILADDMSVNCGGGGGKPGCAIACCCSVPSIITKWLCN